MIADVKPFFDANSNTISYIVRDPRSHHAAIIDSVLGFDYASGTIMYTQADNIVNYVESEQLIIDWHVETHVHADHISAAPYLQERCGGLIAISEHIIDVQQTFGKFFNAGTEFKRNGDQFDKLFKDQDIFRIGYLEAKCIHTPGHTPACMTYFIGDSAFVGDTLFMPDGGTARADFPGGNAKCLFHSIQNILALPDNTRIFVCHDYMPGGRDFSYETSVKAQKRHNIHVKVGISEGEFVAMREARDATLSTPDLIMPSIQLNMRAGKMPLPENNGETYLKIPLSGLKN
jgi:glyoxylase-like metal-dependent hydrolase (beta-lactamase superfamily II)